MVEVKEKNQEILKEIKDISVKLAGVESSIYHQKEDLDRISTYLIGLDKTKSMVDKHDVQLRGFMWVLGVIVSFLAAKMFGKLGG